LPRPWHNCRRRIEHSTRNERRVSQADQCHHHNMGHVPNTPTEKSRILGRHATFPLSADSIRGTSEHRPNPATFADEEKYPFLTESRSIHSMEGIHSFQDMTLPAQSVMAAGKKHCWRVTEKHNSQCLLGCVSLGFSQYRPNWRSRIWSLRTIEA
jgi:hypothetical protein